MNILTNNIDYKYIDIYLYILKHLRSLVSTPQGLKFLLQHKCLYDGIG